MHLGKRFEIILFGLAFVFSWWLMFKSFSYDRVKHQFNIARNEVGDFGLHLSLIRSFSWGSNFPVESPFFSGKPLPYHYFFDLSVGLLERLGVRIDMALNGLSALSFTLLLVLIYTLSQLIFGKNRLMGLTSVALFLFPSTLSFIDFFQNKQLSPTLVREVWMLPDYIHKGPFDRSLISIYFTPAVYLNQRHLIAGMAIGLGIIYILLEKILNNRKVSSAALVLLGTALGLLSRIHSLIFLSTLIVLLSLLILFKKYKWLIMLFVPSLLVALLAYHDVLGRGGSLLSRNFFYPGFLSQRPFTLGNFIVYWWSNLSLTVILTPLGFLAANLKQRKIFLSFFLLFIIANLFQLSFRIEHNHSLINYFLIVANFYTAFILIKICERGVSGKIISAILLIFLTASGVINLMAVKNDFRYPVADAPSNRLMEWIKINTDKRAVFLSRQNLYDPVTLAGRKNYFGATYYLLVMGYDFANRQQLTKNFFEATQTQELAQMRQQKIAYIVIPLTQIRDFPYTVDRNFFRQNLPLVYSDSEFAVYKL